MEMTPRPSINLRFLAMVPGNKLEDVGVRATVVGVDGDRGKSPKRRGVTLRVFLPPAAIVIEFSAVIFLVIFIVIWLGKGRIAGNVLKSGRPTCPGLSLSLIHI